MSGKVKKENVCNLECESDLQKCSVSYKMNQNFYNSDVHSVCSELEDNVEEVGTVADVIKGEVIEGSDTEVRGNEYKIKKPTYISKVESIWQ